VKVGDRVESFSFRADFSRRGNHTVKVRTGRRGTVTAILPAGGYRNSRCFAVAWDDGHEKRKRPHYAHNELYRLDIIERLGELA